MENEYSITYLTELGHRKTYKEDKEFIRKFYYWLIGKGYRVINIKSI